MIIASPGYHGSVSGLIKNALDLLEETAADPRVYLTGIPSGVIATAYGWQATGGTIAALRAIVHVRCAAGQRLLAAAVNSAVSRFADDGACSDPAVMAQLGLVGAAGGRFPQAACAGCLVEPGIGRLAALGRVHHLDGGQHQVDPAQRQQVRHRAANRKSGR